MAGKRNEKMFGVQKDQFEEMIGSVDYGLGGQMTKNANFFNDSYPTST